MSNELGQFIIYIRYKIICSKINIKNVNSKVLLIYFKYVYLYKKKV